MNFKRKLWWAQHRTDVYKYGTILSLVLIVTISIIYFTYSKFSSTNEMTMYETTVEPFIKNDYFIASYIDGEWSNEIPGKDDGYVVDKIVCDNGATGTWDNDEWGINIRNATKKIKCSVYFIVKPLSVTEKITTLATTDTTNFATDDPDNNIRYIGANPNNYVYFNCSDYNNQSDSTCEKWRIIGVFKNMTKSDGTEEDLVKIIRDDSIGEYSWDSSDSSTNSGTGVNDWTNVDAMKLLNSGYDSETVGGSLYWNAKSGTCYNGWANATTSCDFTSTGLKNDSTRNAIESVVWNLGGTASYTSASNGLVSHWYGYERGTTVYSGRPTTWIGKVGLMYPSDYGYATSGGLTTNRAACLAKELYNWNGSAVSDCINNDYLFKSSYNQWTLTPRSSSGCRVFYVFTYGSAAISDTEVHVTNAIRPVVYLKSNISISNLGDGSKNAPYQLKL